MAKDDDLTPLQRVWAEQSTEAPTTNDRVTLHLTLDQIAMVHHGLANLGNTDPAKAEAFRELFAMVTAHVQPRTP